MNKVLTISTLALSIFISSCDRLSNSTEKIGETAGDMVKGVESGIKKHEPSTLLIPNLYPQKESQTVKFL